MVSSLDSQSRDYGLKTTGWLQGRLSLSSFLRPSWSYWGLIGKN